MLTEHRMGRPRKPSTSPRMEGEYQLLIGLYDRGSSSATSRTVCANMGRLHPGDQTKRLSRVKRQHLAVCICLCPQAQTVVALR